jgi:MATE family multidrug resistance protein
MFTEKYKKYFFELIDIAFPIWFFFFFLTLRTNINIFFVSNNYTDYRLIEGIGLIELYLNCFVYIVVTGICSGVEILGSNFFGDKNYYQVGVTLNKGKLIALTYYFFTLIINYFFGLKILRLLFGADDETISLVSSYFYLMVFYQLPLLYFNMDLRFLSIIGKSEINNKILIASTIFQFLLNYIFLIKLELGLFGLGLTNCILQIFCSGGLYFYINYINPFPLANVGYTKDCFSKWNEYIKVSLPATCIVAAEWLGFELQSIIIIRYSSLDFSAHIVFVNVQALIIAYSLAINISMAISVGKKIVEHSKEKIIDFVKVSYMFNLIVIVILLFILFLFQDILIDNMTVGYEMKNLVKNSFWVLYIFMFFDNNNFFFMGVLKGYAYLIVPVIVYIIDSYLIALNLSSFFAFSCDLGVKGLWIGMVLGMMLTAFVMFGLNCTIDINKMKNEAIERINKNQIKSRKSSLVSFISKNTNCVEMDNFYKPKNINDFNFDRKIYNDEVEF